MSLALSFSVPVPRNTAYLPHPSYPLCLSPSSPKMTTVATARPIVFGAAHAFFARQMRGTFLVSSRRPKDKDEKMAKQGLLPVTMAKWQAPSFVPSFSPGCVHVRIQIVSPRKVAPVFPHVPALPRSCLLFPLQFGLRWPRLWSGLYSNKDLESPERSHSNTRRPQHKPNAGQET